MKKVTLADVDELSRKYSVTIEIKFDENTRAIVENNFETHVVRTGFTSNLFEDVEKICVAMNDRQNIRMKEIDERLKKVALGMRNNKKDNIDEE